MKVKLDEGLSVSLAERLAKHGIDADAVYRTSRSLPFRGSLGVRFPRVTQPDEKRPPADRGFSPKTPSPSEGRDGEFARRAALAPRQLRTSRRCTASGETATTVLTRRGDALFELADAVLCTEAPVRALVSLSLAPAHRRDHGARYDGPELRLDAPELVRTAVAPGRPGDTQAMVGISRLRGGAGVVVVGEPGRVVENRVGYRVS